MTPVPYPRAVRTLLAATLTASLMAFWAPVRAQPLPAGRLQAALDAAVADPATPFRGALVHVHGGGDTAWSGAAGVADLGGTALAPQAPFRAGSIAKPLVATVVLQLVEEGAFALDDPITALLPADVTQRFEGSDRVTLRMLLDHTSGIPEWIDGEAIARIGADPSKVWATTEFLDLAAAKRRQFEPGAGWAYSNTDYNLLGLVIEGATGRSWREEVRARVLTPLGLAGTWLPEPGDASLPADSMHGYGLIDGAVVDLSHVDPSMAGAAGGGALVTTTEDLATFLEALLDGRMFRDPGSLAAMTDFVDAADAGGQVGYGLGLQRYLFPGDLVASDAFPAGLEAIGHLGGTAGYASFVAYVPALDLTVALAIDVQGDPTPVLAAVLRVLAAAGAGGAL